MDNTYKGDLLMPRSYMPTAECMADLLRAEEQYADYMAGMAALTAALEEEYGEYDEFDEFHGLWVEDIRPDV